MRIGAFFIYLLSLCIAQNIQAQEPYFIQYDKKNELDPHMDFYHVFQDQEGFMWMCGRTGIARFNGRDFEKFNRTTQGLVERGHIKGYEDFSGKLWFIGLNDGITCYEQGRFFPYPHSNVLQGLLGRDRCVSFEIDSSGTLHAGLVGHGYFTVSPGGELKKLVTDKTHPPGVYVGQIFGRCFVFTISDRINNTSNIPLYRIDNKGAYKFMANVYQAGEEHENFGHIRFLRRRNQDVIISMDSRLLEMTSDTVMIHRTNVTLTALQEDRRGGLWLASTQESGVFYSANGTVIDALNRQLLPNVPIHAIANDDYGGVWLTTSSQGVYHLPYPSYGTLGYEADTIRISDTSWGAGCLDDRLFFAGEAPGVFHGTDGNKVHTYQIPELDVPINLVYFNEFKEEVHVHADEWFYAIRDSGVLKMRLSGGRVKNRAAIFTKSGDTLWLARGKGLIALEDNHVVSESPSIPYHILTICKQGHRIYAGTSAGFWMYDGSKWTDLSQRYPRLKGDIVHTTVFDGKVWVAHFENGLFMLDRDQIVPVLDQHGFVMQAVFSSFQGGNQLKIVAANGRLITISSAQPAGEYVVENFTSPLYYTLHGVNGWAQTENRYLMVSNQKVFTYNPEYDLDTSKVHLSIRSIKVNQQDRLLKEHFVLPFDSNTVDIYFTGLSFQGHEEWWYEYRMSRTEGWSMIRDQHMHFTSLSPGDYTFQVRLRNLHYEASPIQSVSFTVLLPFYRSWWFALIVGLLLVLLAWGAVHFAVQRVKKKAHLINELYRSKQQALAARMNPHFIFNSLSSIHQYTLENTPISSAEYVSSYANLMRRVVDFSEETFVSLADELEALNSYLKLEALRSDNQIRYQLNIDESLDVNEVMLPGLMIWPYLENAIWHGLIPSRKTDKELCIGFIAQCGYLEIEIHDNGIGRVESQKKGTSNHPGYEAVGTAIAEKRIELINRIYRTDICVEVEDLHDESGEPSGTLVRLRTPLFGM